MARDTLAAARGRLDRDEWTRYWERGTVTTFEGHFRDNYDAEIREFWWRQFASLDDGAVIVDLATGNGALPLLAARYGREHERRFSITGVDSAAIDAARLLAAHPELAGDLAGVTLRGDTPLEETGLAEAAADLVTSQYGFEYGDTAAGAREAARILRGGGRLAMVLHHEASAILDQAREGLAQVALCVEQEQLLSTARRLIKLLGAARPAKNGRSPALSPGAAKVRDEMLASIERIRARAAHPAAQAADTGFIEFVVPAVTRLVDQSRGQDPQRINQAMNGIRAEIDQYRLRMADLVSAARTAAGMDLIRDQLAAAGFAGIERKPLIYSGDTLLGWTLVAVRP